METVFADFGEKPCLCCAMGPITGVQKPIAHVLRHSIPWAFEPLWSWITFGGSHVPAPGARVSFGFGLCKNGGGGVRLKLWVKPGCSPRYTQTVPKWHVDGQPAGTD